MTSLTTIAKRFREIASALDAPAGQRIFRIEPHHDGSRHCEFDGEAYSLTTSERGLLLDHQTTTDPNELLFWLVRDMTRQLASDYELANRPDEHNGDTRIAMFDRHVELLGRIDDTWALRQRVHYDQTLSTHPGDGG